MCPGKVGQSAESAPRLSDAYTEPIDAVCRLKVAGGRPAPCSGSHLSRFPSPLAPAHAAGRRAAPPSPHRRDWFHRRCPVAEPRRVLSRMTLHAPVSNTRLPRSPPPPDVHSPADDDRQVSAAARLGNKQGVGSEALPFFSSTNVSLILLDLSLDSRQRHARHPRRLQRPPPRSPALHPLPPPPSSPTSRLNNPHASRSSSRRPSLVSRRG